MRPTNTPLPKVGRVLLAHQQMLHVCRVFPRAQRAGRALKLKAGSVAVQSRRAGGDTQAVQTWSCCTQHTIHAFRCPYRGDHRRSLGYLRANKTKQMPPKKPPQNYSSLRGRGGGGGVPRRQARRRLFTGTSPGNGVTPLFSPLLPPFPCETGLFYFFFLTFAPCVPRVYPVGHAVPTLTLTLKCRSPLFGLFSCFFGRFAGTSLRHAQADHVHGVVYTVISKNICSTDTLSSLVYFEKCQQHRNPLTTCVKVVQL